MSWGYSRYGQKQDANSCIWVCVLLFYIRIRLVRSYVAAGVFRPILIKCCVFNSSPVFGEIIHLFWISRKPLKTLAIPAFKTSQTIVVTTTSVNPVKKIEMHKFESIEQFKQELVEYLDYYNNRRIKAKLKGLPPAIHRQQALSASWTIFTSKYCLTFWGHFKNDHRDFTSLL